MTYTLRFLPEVEDDALSGFSWYEMKSPGLDDEFLRMFYACVSDIPRNPLLYRKVHKEFWRCLLRRFPCAIYFTIANDKIIVTGLFHCARDPRTVESMLQSRKE